MSKYPVYGFPCVEDPNDFEPDHESCSPKEIAAHKLACETFGKPQHKPNEGCFSEYDENGNLMLHVVRTSWGIGTNLIDQCDGCKDMPDGNLMMCHECGGQEFCEACWPKHEKWHEEG